MRHEIDENFIKSEIVFDTFMVIHKNKMKRYDDYCTKKCYRKVIN